MLVEVMVISKGEYCDRMHILPLANLTLSGISIHMCLERLVSLIKEEGKTNCPTFCDTECYMLSAAAIESVFNPILEVIQIYRNRSLEDYIPR